MAGIHITDIEAAINWWRERSPSPDGVSLPATTRALAEVYALMVFFRESEADEHTMPAAARETPAHRRRNPRFHWAATSPVRPARAGA